MNIKNILKGILYGIFSIIPGLSGGILAKSFGDYDKLINIYNEKTFNKSSITYVLFIFTGFYFGMTFFSKIILYLFNNYFMLFKYMIILINIIILIKYIKKSNCNLKDLITFFIISIIIYFVFNIFNFKLDKYKYLSFIYLGIIYSISKIIPGLSGTSILVHFNLYEKILVMLSNPVKSFISFPFKWSLFLVSFLIVSIILLKLIYKYNDFFDYIIVIIMFINIIIVI